MQGCHTGHPEAFWRANRAGGQAALSISPYMNRRGTVDREITVSNLLYCSNFSYYFPPTWSPRGWQSKMAAHGSVPVPV
jgi:hypothetical protein